MERVLLWASVVVGLVVYLCRFLPVARPDRSTNPPPEGAVGTAPPLHPTLRLVALAAPVLGLLVTLPPSGLFFSAGARLGIGFLIGGVGALLSALPLLRGRRDDAPAPVALAANVGVAAAAVAVALLTLRSSILDGLMGVAIGWFCAAFPLLLALPAAERDGAAGRRIAAGMGTAAALAAGALLGVFRDEVTPALARLTWSASLTGFAALGALFVAGAALVPGVPANLRRTLPLFALALGGGLALWQVAVKVAGEPRLLYAGLGGVLLGPVALAVLRDGVIRRRLLSPATPAFAVPALAVLVVASGFLASLQALQGVGAAGFVVALWLSVAATAALSEDGTDAPSPVPTGAVGLALFATVLLLWRAFTTRFGGDLRGVTLTDQYALFGLLVGAALPSLLTAAPERWRGGANGGTSGAALMTLAWCAVLSVAAPGAALLLFGPKSAVALLIGLALGGVLALSGRTSLLPATLALAVALALDQFSGRVLGALDAAEVTRAGRLRWLAGIAAVTVAVMFAADRAVNSTPPDTEEAEA
jgi:hypothetical protein